MKTDFYKEKNFQIAIASIICIFSLSLYTYNTYDTLNQRSIEISKKQLLLNYQLYNKIIKSNKNPKDILIENLDYIDNEEMVNELSKSTPLMGVHQKKDIPKYNLTIKFVKTAMLYSFDIAKKIEILEEKDYFIEINDNQIKLFGLVEGKGFVLMEKQLHDRDFNEELSLYFQTTFILFSINIIVFFYLLSLVKSNKNEQRFMEQEYKYLQDDTKKLAFEDTLTKAATRLKFDETLKDLIPIASRFNEQKFSLVILDIDNFKKVNDTYGHDYGDIVLKKVANIIKNYIRGSDTFARWGGEEFIILLPMNNLEQSVLFAEKVRVLISQAEFEKLDCVTCSFGVVEFVKGDTVETIVKRADELLYKAKNTGKNKVAYE